MKKAYLFVFGGSGTLLLSVFIFVIVPRLGVSSVVREGVSAQSPYSERQLLGRQVYIEYGCLNCHSQQVRDPAVGADVHFGWGRASLPSDYIYDRPHLMGTSRTGPDLSNIGSRQPSSDWHHLHLYNPRLLVSWSTMPGFSFLYQFHSGKEPPVADALKLPESDSGWIVPSQEARDLVDYLSSLKRDRQPLKPGEEKKP